MSSEIQGYLRAFWASCLLSCTWWRQVPPNTSTWWRQVPPNTSTWWRQVPPNTST